MESYESISDRIIKISFNSKPSKLHIFQVYLPTTDHSEEEVDAEYEQLERVISNVPQEDIVIVTGDFKVGNTEHDHQIRNVKKIWTW